MLRYSPLAAICLFHVLLVVRPPFGLAGVAGLAVSPPVLVGAGDIAACDSVGAEATAQLLDQTEGTIFTAGDHAYKNGTWKEFQSCYQPTWGRHKDRTRPSPGNHDYRSPQARPYYTYFGENAGPTGLGYYSYDLGGWHIVSLNSNIAIGKGSPQIRWLREDLAANPTPCTVAYWHHPLFSSGKHGNSPHVQEVWRVLYEFGVDVVINGHDHSYERFAPQTPDGDFDPVRGIREFVVGTGGKDLRRFQWWNWWAEANSEVRDHSTFGVLKLALHETRYEWEFIPVAGGSFRDAGQAECIG